MLSLLGGFCLLLFCLFLEQELLFLFLSLSFLWAGKSIFYHCWCWLVWASRHLVSPPLSVVASACLQVSLPEMSGFPCAFFGLSFQTASSPAGVSTPRQGHSAAAPQSERVINAWSLCFSLYWAEQEELPCQQAPMGRICTERFA